MNERIQDTIVLTVRAADTVVSETVKITATVNAVSESGKADDELKADIRGMLRKLIPDADWKFSGLLRALDAARIERITLTASARVDEKENYKLEERAEQVSKPGLTISSIQADLKVPEVLLEAAEKKLRREIVKKALEEAADMEEVTGRAYRVAAIEYETNDPIYRKSPAYGVQAAAASANAFYSAPIGGAADEDSTILNTQRVTLAANVTLAVIVPTHSYDDALSVQMRHRMFLGMGKAQTAENERLWLEENPGFTKEQQYRSEQKREQEEQARADKAAADEREAQTRRQNPEAYG